MFEALTLGVIATAFGAGLRHGADWDHIAAITDITGTQTDRRSSLLLASAYALGHALVVVIVGLAAILVGRSLPASIDTVMQRVVGATLVFLGIYLLLSLLRSGRSFQMKSRWMLLGEAITGLKARLRIGQPRYGLVEVEHEHPHDHGGPGHGHSHQDAAGPLLQSGSQVLTRHAHRHTHAAMVPVASGYGRKTAFLVGMLHGVGAETPTQLLVFVTAAGIGGRATGVAILLAFVTGLVVTNTAIAVAATYGFMGAGTRFPVYALIGGLTAVGSIALGVTYLL